jgi:hypothetical protein
MSAPRHARFVNRIAKLFIEALQRDPHFKRPRLDVEWLLRTALRDADALARDFEREAYRDGENEALANFNK